MRKHTNESVWLKSIEQGAAQFPLDKLLNTLTCPKCIGNDMRRYRKSATLRGVGLCDMLERGMPDWWTLRDGINLVEFNCRCVT